MISSPAINSLFTKLHQSDKNENKSVKRNQFKSQRECAGPVKVQMLFKTLIEHNYKAGFMTLIEPLVIQVCGDADDTFKAQHVASVDADFGGGTGSLKVHCSVKISQLKKPTILFACSMT